MMIFKTEIPFCLDEEYFQLGIMKYLNFSDFRVQGQRCLVCGPSGSGKTVLTASLLGKLSLYIPNICIYIVDYKGMDYTYCEGMANYYAVDHALTGFNTFFELFENRLYKRVPSNHFVLLMVDEFPSLLMSLSKKEQEEINGKLARMLNLSRSFRIHLCFALQRPSADVLLGRENFNHRFLMGSMANNKESVAMIANEYKDIIEPCPVGVGYYISDIQIKKIRSVLPRNTPKLHKVICEAVNRRPSGGAEQ